MKQKATVGYSVEAIVKVLDGVTNSQVDEPGTTNRCLSASHPALSAVQLLWLDATIRRSVLDYAHIELMKKCIANDIIIIASGCSAQAAAKAGLMDKAAKDLCGAGLKRVCELADIPPVLPHGFLRRYLRMMILQQSLLRMQDFRSISFR